MSSSSIKNPLAPRNWPHYLTAALATVAGATARTSRSLFAADLASPAADG